MRTRLRHVEAWWVACGVTLLLSCSPGGTPIQLSEEEFNEYWQQMEVRLAVWVAQENIPMIELPDRAEMYHSLRFSELPPEQVLTCYFRTPDSIVIGADKWLSGCVPHEIGHAVLYKVKHSCWRVYEHNPTEHCTLSR